MFAMVVSGQLEKGGCYLTYMVVEVAFVLTEFCRVLVNTKIVLCVAFELK